jgi:hypothetical protein
MLVNIQKINIRSLTLSKINFREIDIRKSAISLAVGLLGLTIVSLPLVGSTFHLDAIDPENRLPYFRILLLSSGVFTIGLALIIFSINLFKRLIWGSLVALLFVAFALGCFALGIFFKCFFVAIIALTTVAWEIGKNDLEC